jgi:NADPH:quinone reductase-like Zn-dependent oxidoreductase
MHAIIFEDVETLKYVRVADPGMLDEGDVIVEVDAAGIW